MAFSPELAEIRFGCGLSPVVTPVVSKQAMLDGLTGPDTMVDRFPIEHFDEFLNRMVVASEMRKRMKKARGTPDFDGVRKEYQVLNKVARVDMVKWFGRTLLRRVYSQTTFRERLAYFWGDHFSATGKTGLIRRATSPYIEDAIRPNISGRFADMLIAAVSHPTMLHYLDQVRSMGSDSVRAIKKGNRTGLNENLAREVLELHTLGVDGPYTQTDVRQLAELFTGMSFQPKVGLQFRRDYVEPGPETVLGRTYGDKPLNMTPILAVLEDLSVHPATAQHISWKLAVHFVADKPDPALVEHMTTRYRESDGDLMAVYAAMLDHPAAWAPELRNVKTPVEFVTSTARALQVHPERIDRMNEKRMRGTFIGPMRLMGQNWQKPLGPDGWPEEDDVWISPQNVAARLQWAMAAPRKMRPNLPDPRTFVDVALGARAPAAVKFAAGAAESKSEAIGLVLASPAFQRR